MVDQLKAQWLPCIIFTKMSLEVEMSTSNWILLLTSISAAIVALIGFLLNQIALRNERRSRVYAEALSAVFEFQELPYRIRKRASSEDSSAIIA
jgi:predicted permease